MASGQQAQGGELHANGPCQQTTAKPSRRDDQPGVTSQRTASQGTAASDVRLSDLHPVGPQASDSPQQSCSFQSNCSGPSRGFVSFSSPTLSVFFSRSLSSFLFPSLSEPKLHGFLGVQKARTRLHGFGVQKASKATQAARVLCGERNENKPTATRATVCGGSWLCRAVTPCH